MNWRINVVMLDFLIYYYLNLERGYHYIFKDVFFVFGIVLLNYISPRWKKENKIILLFKAFLIAFGIWCVLIIFSSIVYSFVDKGLVFAIAFPLISLIFTFILSKDRMIERLILSLSFYIIFIFSIRTSDTFSYIILNTKDYIKDDPLSIKIDILRSLFSFLLISIECFILTLFNTRKCKTIDTRSALILSIIFFIVHFYQAFSNKGTWLENAIGNTLLIVILYLTYIMFYLATKEYNKKLEYQIIANQSNQKLEQISLLNNSYEDFKKIRHEIKNQYAIMAMLLEKKEYNKLEEIFGSFNNQLLNVVKFYDCGNEVVNQLLNIEASKAKSKNIKVDFNVAVSSKLNIDDSDIISLLSNLIDNALEAIERYNYQDTGVILKMWEQNGNLFIMTQNKVLEDQIDLNNLSTKKLDKDSHGYGLKIIEKIVNKYKGYIKFSIKNQFFIVDVYIPMKGNE